MATTTIFQSRETPTVVRKNAKALRAMEDDVSTLQTDVTAVETAITGLDSPAGTATICNRQHVGHRHPQLGGDLLRRQSPCRRQTWARAAATG